MNYLMVKRVV